MNESLNDSMDGQMISRNAWILARARGKYAVMSPEPESQYRGKEAMDLPERLTS